MNDKTNIGNEKCNVAMAADKTPSTKRRRLFAGMLATSLAAVSVVGYAAGAVGGDAHHGQGMHGDGYAAINVTHLHAIAHQVMDGASPEQKAKFDALAAIAKPELEALDAQARAAHRETVELLLQDTADRSAVEQAQSRELQAADRLATRINQALADLSELMTPEQKARMRAHAQAHAG